MNVTQAQRLVRGDVVTVPFGRKQERREAIVVSVDPPRVWGRGRRPWNAGPNDRYCVVVVDLGGRVGVRSYGNSLVSRP